MTLKEQYKKETNSEVYILDRFTSDFDNTKYVEWLEAKINYKLCCESDSEQLVCSKCGSKAISSAIDSNNNGCNDCGCNWVN